MNMQKHLASLVLLLLVGSISGPVTPCAAQGSAATQVTMRPEETDEILANPGMGWETFHRPAARQEPARLDSVDRSYVRWGWGELEPQPWRDRLACGPLLNETHDSGQKLAFRVMCCSTDPGHPTIRVVKRDRRQGAVVDHDGSGRCRFPTWTTRSCWSGISISSSGWASDTTAIPTSTMSTSARWAGGANGISAAPRRAGCRRWRTARRWWTPTWRRSGRRRC